MRITKERQREHISQIKRVLVINPDSSILDIKEALANKQKNPLNLDKNYINRLVNKIRKERVKRLDNYTINVVLARFQDEVEELKKRLWLIITNPVSLEKDKIAAIKELRTSSKDLFDKMFDAGVFKRKIGELAIGSTLSQEEQDLIDKAIRLDYGKKPKPEPKPNNTTGGTNSGESPSITEQDKER